MTHPFWWSALIVFDLALMAAVGLALTVQFFSPPYDKQRDMPEVVKQRTLLQRGALMLSFSLLMVQAVCSLFWDMWHNNDQPHAQFPLVWRMSFTVPIFLLANYSLLGEFFRSRVAKSKNTPGGYLWMLGYVRRLFE